MTMFVISADISHRLIESRRDGDAVSSVITDRWLILSRSTLSISSLASVAPSAAVNDATTAVQSPQPSPSVTRYERLNHLRLDSSPPTPTKLISPDLDHPAGPGAGPGKRRDLAGVSGADDDRVGRLWSCQRWRNRTQINKTRSRRERNPGSRDGHVMRLVHVSRTAHAWLCRPWLSHKFLHAYWKIGEALNLIHIPLQYARCISNVLYLPYCLRGSF